MKNLIKNILIWMILFCGAFGFIIQYNNEYIVRYDIKIIENEGPWQGEILYNYGDFYNNIRFRTVTYQRVLQEFQHVQLSIKDIPYISKIRLDPLLKKGKIVLKNLSVIYQDQIYNIDLSKLENATIMRNMSFLNQSEDGITLQCSAEDPGIEFQDNIEFTTITFRNIVLSFILSMVFFGIFLLIKRYGYETIILTGMIVFYIFYVLFFSSWNMGINILYVFGLLALITVLLYGNKEKLKSLQGMGIFILLYLTLAYLSIYWSTQLANLDYLNEKTLLIIAASVIPLAYIHIKDFSVKKYKIIITILFVIMSILLKVLDLKIILIDQVYILNWLMERNEWTQKNYMFAYVLLTFGTLAFYDFKKKKELIAIFSIIAIAFFVISGGYSKSALLAFIVGTVIYLLNIVFRFKKNFLLVIIWILTMYIICSPILFSFLELASYHSKFELRDAIYHTSAALIKEHWLFGYGFGSILDIHTKDWIALADLPKNYLKVFPGGHPHNLSLLFWLEFGILGAMFLAYFIHRLLEMFIQNTYDKINLPALFGMIVSFDIITSFSWSILHPQVILTFAFFGLILALGMNINIKRVKD